MTLQQHPTLRHPPSLAVTPAVVAHRGASGYLPEHTLAAYRAAIDLGADDIELDLVSTLDGVLLARHEQELSLTTDVAEHPELADRRTTKVVNGREATGWFADDLTLDEVRRLSARERLPELRPGSAAHDGLHPVPTFDEVLTMLAEESAARGRSIGVLVELKDAAWSAARGLSLEQPLVDDLRRHGLDHARSRVSVMSLESAVLRSLAPVLRVPLIQLLDAPVGPAGLAEIERYADGIGARHNLVVRDVAGTMVASPLVRDAHREWLTVHVWTLRAEAAYLPAPYRGQEAHGDLAGYASLLLDLGVDGLITDHPDLVLAARDRDVAPRRGS
ncbi:Glycerophosphoryl diester phosphodiesterase precursor [Nocardioides dokdonensis FR1436]|uniref:glycerophosphodiester phosphodiesterase n=1 Tax=Nocardioides dokdonensis FR1436 TaxID=1300347 RepID=A0A1A9GGT9_9ACTN|nr:glycerophosphodiester phosphodiesterase family protein [Nocardioides dokdonensis]ANH36741.1 Glycerophosphoryl diester phosphodiesterase precursor [Nocardioides dokdonensis FR1436]